MTEGGALRAQAVWRRASLYVLGVALLAVAIFALLNADLLEAWGGSLAGRFRHGLPLPLTLVVVFIAGVLTSLTPCVYPVVPLAVTYLGARSATSRAKAFSLAAAYVLGMVVCYTALGAAAGLTGTTFGAATQKWWVYALVATVVLLFGLSMLGLFNFRLPPALQRLVGQSKGPGYKGAIFMGATSGLVTAPCTAPVLGTLILPMIAKQSVALGSLLLAVFGLGMGMLFLVVGTYSGVLTRLPRSGSWMNVVKIVLGGAILLVAGYFYYQAWTLLPFRSRPSVAAGRYTILPAFQGGSSALDRARRDLHAASGDLAGHLRVFEASFLQERAPVSVRGRGRARHLAGDGTRAGSGAAATPGAAASAGAAATPGVPPGGPGSAPERKAAPPFELEDIKGGHHDLNAYRGRTLHLAFSAIWCPPCLDQLRQIEVADARLRGKGYTLLLVAMKDRENDEKLREFARQRTLAFPVAWDRTGEVARAFGIDSIPAHVVIGPDGRILYEGEELPEGFERDGAGLLPP